MAKIKISELAKELGVEGKAVVAYLQEQGVEAAKRSTSSVEEEDAEKARKYFAKDAHAAPKDEEKKPAAKKTAEDRKEDSGKAR